MRVVLRKLAPHHRRHTCRVSVSRLTPPQEIDMSNRLITATAGLLTGAAMLTASLSGAAISQASSGVDQQGTYPKASSYDGVQGGVALCSQHGIKMPCGPNFTPGITKSNNEG